MDVLRIHLSIIDYVVIGTYFIFALAVGFIMKGDATRNMRSYFLSGQKLSWLFLGTSMAATTFALDTPLCVAGWTRMAGISKNWEHLVFLFGAMFTTFFFAKLWRRSNVLNDAEFLHLRYSGPEASFLRGFRALYMGFIMNMLVIGGQLVAISKIGTLLLGVSSSDPNYVFWKWGVAITCGLTATVYCYLSGFGAIVITDFVQFGLSMAGAILLAVFICLRPEVGGLAGMVKQLQITAPEKLNFIPAWKPSDMAAMSLLVVIGYSSIRWWAQVYGGAEPGGQAHVAQRMLAARSEKDALFGTLWFNIASYALKPLPWIITALATLIIFPLSKYSNHEEVYFATINFVPVGLRGLVVTSLVAAFMSTVDTRINLGASYFVNDFYKPFLVKNRSEDHYVKMSKWITIIQVIIAYGMLFLVSNMRSVFFIYAGLGSGAGLVYILRFYWWRISAWSELAAMTAAFVCLVVFRWGIYGTEEAFEAHGFQYMFISFFIVTAIWMTVTLITRPCSKDKLQEFYKKVKPAGPFWKSISNELSEREGIRSSDNLKIALVGWLFSNPMILGFLFGIGNILLHRFIRGVVWLAIAVVSGMITFKCVSQMTTSDSTEE